MKIFDGKPVVRQEADAAADHDGGQEGGQVRAVQQDGRPVHPVGREEERRSPDDRHARGQAVQSVDEVERVHRGHNQPRRQHNAHGLVLNHDRLGDERDDRHPDTPDGHDQGGGALADQLDPPAQVQEIVRHADKHDHGGTGEDSPGRVVVPEDVLDEERIARHDQCHQEPCEDAQAAEPGDRGRMHVAAADRGDTSSSLLPTSAGTPCRRVAHDRCRQHHEQVHDHGEDHQPVAVSAGTTRQHAPQQRTHR